MLARCLVGIVALFVTFTAVAEEANVPDILTKAALYIFSADHVHDDPEYIFTAAELEVLRNQRENVVKMIIAALGHRHSVVGADLSAYFDWEECIPVIRHQFFRPGRFYGWEGTDLNDPNAHLSDHQYVYHKRYLAALHHFYGDRLGSELNFTDYEKELIKSQSQSSRSDYRNWGLWMQEKLAESFSQ